MPKGNENRELRSKKKDLESNDCSKYNQEEMNAIEKSLSEINKKLDELNRKMAKSEARDKEFKERMGRIEDHLNDLNEMRKDMDSILAENRCLKNRIVSLESETRKIKAEKLVTSLEIYGIPSVEGENTKAIIHDLARKAKVKLADGDLVESFRPRNTNNRERPIKARMISVKVKNDLVKALKESRLRLGDIDKRPENKKIYANEAILPETKRLLFLVKEKIIVMKWHKAWVYANDVYLLMSEKGQRIRISNEEDLINLKDEVEDESNGD